jgi:glycosyltransferase involved in cell wall biosynthesis
VPIDSALPSRTFRVTYDGRLDNKRRVYERCAAGIESPEAHVVANDALELGMISSLGMLNPTAFVLHGDYDYYYDLALAHASRIGSFVCVSKKVRDTLASRLPGREADVHLAHPIVPEPGRVRSRNAEPAPLALLFIGRTSPEKGFPDLPVVDRLLAELGVDVRWTIVAPDYGMPGEGERAWLSGPNVRRIESVPDTEMERVYSKHDILVAPSRYEGFGMAVVEAMKSRVVPVVARLDAGISEIIDDGITGFATNPGDTASMAAHIAALAADRGRIESMADAARRTALARFDSRAALDAMTRAIFSATAHPRGRGPDYLSTLDRRWLPNSLVRFARRTRAMARLDS